MTNLIVAKIYDNDCPICEAMSKYDEETLISLDPTPTYIKRTLSEIVSLDNDSSIDALLAHLVERYACNSDYTVDLPVYMLVEGKNYLGHSSGECSPHELRTRLQGAMDGRTNKES